MGGRQNVRFQNMRSIPRSVSYLCHFRFNVYIHDYFLKRGFRKAAKELVQEAEIGSDASPPINARQGFLFEYAFFSFLQCRD